MASSSITGSLPRLTLREWIVSLALRAGVPFGAVALLVYFVPMSEEADRIILAWVSALSATWFIHWYAAMLRDRGFLKHWLASCLVNLAFLTVAVVLFVWLVAILMYFFPSSTTGSWEATKLALSSRLESSGVFSVYMIAACLRVVSVAYRKVSDRLRPSEFTWWLDWAVSVVRVLAWCWVALGFVAVGSLLVFEGESPWFAGSWSDGVAVFVGQLRTSGMLGIVFAGIVLSGIHSRINMQLRAMSGGWGAIIRTYCTVRGVAYVAAWVCLIVAGVVAGVCLIDPLGLPFEVLWPATVQELGAAGLIGCGLGICAVAVAIVWYRDWRDDKPLVVRFFLWILIYGSLAGLIYLALYDATKYGVETGYVVIPSLVLQAQAGYAQPSLWSAIAYGVIWLITVIFWCAVAIFVLSCLAGGDVGGGGALEGAGSGGGGGSSGGAGFGSSTLRDRYGNRLASAQSGWGGSQRVYDANGKYLGSTYQGLGGATHLNVHGHDVTVEDSAVGNGKVVREDGKVIGRITESQWGGDPVFRDER